MRMWSTYAIQKVEFVISGGQISKVMHCVQPVSPVHGALEVLSGANSRLADSTLAVEPAFRPSIQESGTS
jgi:hypothetical protein